MDFIPTKDPFPVVGHLFAYVNPHTSEVNNFSQCTLVGKKVEFPIVTKDSNGDHYVKGGSQESVQLKSFTGDVTAGEVMITDNDDGSYMASFIAKQVGEAKVLVSINEEKITGSSYSVVMNNSIAKLRTIIVAWVNPSWGIAFGRNGLWAVADFSNHRVYI